LVASLRQSWRLDKLSAIESFVILGNPFLLH
jgi:hypothetical protein